MVIRSKFTEDDIYALFANVFERNATNVNEAICEVAKIQKVLAHVLNDLCKELQNGK